MENQNNNDINLLKEAITLMNKKLSSMGEYVRRIVEESDNQGPLYCMAPFSNETDKIDAALAAAQLEFKDVIKGQRGYNYNYADLASIKAAISESLSKHKIALIQPWEPYGSKAFYLATIARCDGQWIKSGFVVDITDLCLDKDNKMALEQKVGKRITYYRKYAITSLLFLYGEDTDSIK